MKTSTIPSTFPSIQLTADQLMHFTDGEGLNLRNEEGDTVAFIHSNQLDNDPQLVECLQQKLTDTGNVLSFIKSLVVNQDGYIELTPEATDGLGILLSDIQARLQD